MGIENASFIKELNPDAPLGTESISEGDNHIRVIKNALVKSFPNVDGAVDWTPQDFDEIKEAYSNAPESNGIFASCKWNGSTLMYGHNVSAVVLENMSQYRVYFSQPTDGFDHHYAVQVTTIGTTAMTIACVNGQFDDSVSISVREELNPSSGAWGTPTTPVAFYMTMVDMIQTESNSNT